MYLLWPWGKPMSAKAEMHMPTSRVTPTPANQPSYIKKDGTKTQLTSPPNKKYKIKFKAHQLLNLSMTSKKHMWLHVHEPNTDKHHQKIHATIHHTTTHLTTHSFLPPIHYLTPQNPPTNNVATHHITPEHRQYRQITILFTPN